MDEIVVEKIEGIKKIALPFIKETAPLDLSSMIVFAKLEETMQNLNQENHKLKEQVKHAYEHIGKID